MTEPLEVYSLVQRDGRWWLPYGPEADAEALARVFSSDCSVVFLGPDGGSLAYDVTDEGEEVVRLDSGAWLPLTSTVLAPWQQQAIELVMDAIDCM
ncbi:MULTISPECIES: hypothetical protein [unclassified Paracoccus (in: a-proteobacteria)]|uniref:hypothetical protein n=1 Tax=unclassified Paracoccus (in: a-proteobacteria) TaxID=2688777 RepID=UPI0012B32C4B|nr:MULTISPECIES: hypothetical protein [unclassified Paracoccus (in: a-proteobacteria)]UXU74565.1 hypothetical protein GB879_011800 [Paracoccus sp. SMMA_5]UXU80459.1 hypothetical protein GB880_011785 [Paracoccus sp. SMMA_5_TC]